MEREKKSSEPPSDSNPTTRNEEPFDYETVSDTSSDNEDEVDDSEQLTLVEKLLRDCEAVYKSQNCKDCQKCKETSGLCRRHYSEYHDKSEDERSRDSKYTWTTITDPEGEFTCESD